jgi:formate hydrogenlyase subunit 4
MTLYKRLGTNIFQSFYYDFLKFLVKGVLSTTTIFEKYQTTDF